MLVIKLRKQQFAKMPPKKVPRISGQPKTLRSRTNKSNLVDKNNPKIKVTIPLQNVLSKYFFIFKPIIHYCM